MTHIVVTLEYGKEARDLALPADVPARLLIEGLSEALKLRTQTGTLALRDAQVLKPLPSNATLGDMDIVHGSILTLLSDERSTRTAPTPTGQSVGAHLQIENGRTFPLGSLVVIGRTDAKSGIFVEIDLGDFVSDPKIISRRHAQIEQQGGHYYLVDLGSVNGTKLNGQQVLKNSRCLLQDGDRLEFGRHGVKLTFMSRGK